MLRVWAASAAELAAVRGEQLSDVRSLTLCKFRVWGLASPGIESWGLRGCQGLAKLFRC